MKSSKYLLIALLFFGCKPKPEFYIKGKPYYAIKECVKSHSNLVWDWHYGYNPLSLKYEWHYGNHILIVCDKYKIDTIEIK
jgi:hypothetical protein